MYDKAPWLTSCCLIFMLGAMLVDTKLFEDFCKFSANYINSRDIDPVYPVLKNTYRHFGLSINDSIWFTYLYVTYYNLNSAEYMWNRFPHPSYISGDCTHPTGVERRGFRGNDLARVNVHSMMDITGGDLESWVIDSSQPMGRAGWQNMRKAFEMVKWNGPWSSYKWCDLMNNVHDIEIEAADIGIGGGGKNAGPVPGLVLLTGEDWKVCATDVAMQEELLEMSLDAGVPFNGLDQMETALCDFKNVHAGRYYNGHDIDDMQQKLDDDSIFWAARWDVIPHEYLGEANDWHGVRKHLKSQYIQNGRI